MLSVGLVDAPKSSRGAPVEVPASEPEPRVRVNPYWYLLGMVVLWGWSVARVDETALGEYGLITVLPITTFVAFAGVLGGFAVATRSANNRLMGAYVTVATLMIHGLPPLVYDHLRFSWAWKHVGIVEYITRTGGVDVLAPVHPVYHNWPGFFGLNAWITSASNLESALSYAAWAPVLFNLLFMLGLYVAFRSVTKDSRLIWTGLLLFTLGNWVGQDYFAPQALGFFLYLTVLAIVLRWYSVDRATVAGGRHAAPLEPGSRQAFAINLVLGLVILAVASTHQITPIATAVALAALWLFRVVKVRWPLVVLLVFTAVWALGPARSFVLSNVTDAVTEVGVVEGNLEYNLVSADLFNEAQLRISQVARGLSAAMVAVAGLGWLRRLRHRLPTKLMIVLAGAPVLLIVLSSYGGEVLFRSYLFALPFAAFLGASLWFPTERSALSRNATVGLAAVTMGLALTLLVADFGADNRQVFSDGEVAAADFLFENAQPGALIVEGSRDYPRQHRNYEQFVYLPLDRSRPSTLENLLADPAGRIAGWMSDTDRYQGGFVIITQSQRESVTALGTLLTPTLDTVEASLLASDEFEVVFEQDGARVFAPVGQR